MRRTLILAILLTTLLGLSLARAQQERAALPLPPGPAAFERTYRIIFSLEGGEEEKQNHRMSVTTVTPEYLLSTQAKGPKEAFGSEIQGELRPQDQDRLLLRYQARIEYNAGDRQAHVSVRGSAQMGLAEDMTLAELGDRSLVVRIEEAQPGGGVEPG